jgi:predicted nucleotidyltransferase
MFDTHRLDAALARRAERLERERTAVLERVLGCLESEIAALGLKEAYVVGTLARPHAWTETSDVDVAISGGDPLEVMRRLEAVSGRAVDVIELDRHPEPGMFRRRGIKVLG